MSDHGGRIRITTARRGLSESIRHREIRYLLSMGIRTACFIAAIIVHGPARWVLVVAAFILPYIAVVMANTAGEAESADLTGFAENRPLVEGPRAEDASGS
jgi:DUF3099 family protein